VNAIVKTSLTSADQLQRLTVRSVGGESQAIGDEPATTPIITENTTPIANTRHHGRARARGCGAALDRRAVLGDEPACALKYSARPVDPGR